MNQGYPIEMIRHLIIFCLIVIAAAAYSHAAEMRPPEKLVRHDVCAAETHPANQYTEIFSFDRTIDNFVNESVDGDAPIKRLTLSELICQVIACNQKIQIQKNRWNIQLAEEAGTHAIFEPEFVVSAQHEDNRHKNTVEEALNRQGFAIYGERNWEYSAGIESLIPTGGKINLGYNLNQLSNTLTKSLTGEEDEYQMFFDISLRQPLLKNAGLETTKSAIRVAEKKSSASFQEYRLEMIQTASKAAAAYWDFYQTQQNLLLRRDSVRIADKILVDNRERYRTGKMAETEVLEAMVGVGSRKALLVEAIQQYRDVENRLRTLLALSLAQKQFHFEATDQPFTGELTIDKNTVVKGAFFLRPEYLATREQLEEADIRLSFAENQRWPELDLIASYGLNGLDFDSSDAWQQIEDGDFDSWSVGLEFRLPLGGGIASKSKLHKAKLEKKEQLLSLKEMEINFTNTIDTAIHHVFSAREQVRYTDEIVGMQEKLLDAEMTRLDAGKSNTRLILEKEDSYRNAKEIALKNRVELQKAIIDLDVAGGTILLNHGIEVMETEF